MGENREYWSVHMSHPLYQLSRVYNGLTIKGRQRQEMWDSAAKPKFSRPLFDLSETLLNLEICILHILELP